MSSASTKVLTALSTSLSLSCMHKHVHRHTDMRMNLFADEHAHTFIHQYMHIHLSNDLCTHAHTHQAKEADAECRWLATRKTAAVRQPWLVDLRTHTMGIDICTHMCAAMRINMRADVCIVMYERLSCCRHMKGSM